MDTYIGETIGEVIKDDTNKIVLRVIDYKKDKYLDLRIFYFNESKNEWIPTRKGFTIMSKDIEHFNNIVVESKDRILNSESVG